MRQATLSPAKLKLRKFLSNLKWPTPAKYLRREHVSDGRPGEEGIVLQVYSVGRGEEESEE